MPVLVEWPRGLGLRARSLGPRRAPRGRRGAAGAPGAAAARGAAIAAENVRLRNTPMVYDERDMESGLIIAWRHVRWPRYLYLRCRRVREHGAPPTRSSLRAHARTAVVRIEVRVELCRRTVSVWVVV